MKRLLGLLISLLLSVGLLFGQSGIAPYGISGTSYVWVPDTDAVVYPITITGDWVNTANPWSDAEIASSASWNGKQDTVAGLSSTELGYVNGVTSAIQTQFGAKSDSGSVGYLNQAETITGNWVNTTHPWADNEVASAATWNGKQDTVAGVSSTQIRYLYGLTDTLTELLDAKMDTSTNATIGAKQDTVSGIHDTELGYLYGLTDTVQEQIDAIILSMTIQFTILDPKHLLGDSTIIFSNETGYDVTLGAMTAWSDVDNFDFTLKEYTVSGGVAGSYPMVKAVTIVDNGTNCYYTATPLYPNYPVIEKGNCIWYIASSDTANWGKVSIIYKLPRMR